MRALLLTLLVALSVPLDAQVFLPARRISPSVSGCEYTANTAVFDGTNDWMRCPGASDLGFADTKVLTFAFWLKMNGNDGTTTSIISFATSGLSTRFTIIRTTLNRIQVFGRSAAAATILDLTSTSTITVSSGWVHVYICIDLANAANRKIYFNGVSETLIVSTYTNSTIDTQGVGHIYTFGGSPDTPAQTLIDGVVSEFWGTNAYFDDPTKFISGGCPIDLGATGETPTGSQPVIYLDESGDSFVTNHGGGAQFNLTGSLGTTTPPP